MGELIDGKSIANQLLKQTGFKIKQLRKKNITPKLAVIFVGHNPASTLYVKKKETIAKQIGIDFKLYKFKDEVEERYLLTSLKKIQEDPKLTGLIVQLPLPKHLNTNKILETIKPKIDVDCLTNTNQIKLKNKTSPFLPPTPLAIMVILKKIKTNLLNKKIVILGKGKLVGKPLAVILTNAGAKVFSCNSKTKDIKNKCLEADIIISATGKQGILTNDMIPNNIIVIDAGSNFIGKKVSGDIDFKKIKKKVAYITPTPGGVGPITVSLLLANTTLSAERKFVLWKQ